MSFISVHLLIEHLTIENGLPSNFSFTIHPDSTFVWGCSNDGMWLYDNDSIYTVGSDNGLPFESLYDFIDDGIGHFWIPGEKAILRIKKKDLYAVAKGEKELLDYDLFDEGNGLKSPHCIGAVHSFKDKQGQLWMLTKGGVAAISPKKMKLTHQWPKIHLEEVNADQVVFHNQKKYSIPSNTKRLNFVFTAFDYKTPDKIRFRYKLEPYDKDWIESGSDRFALYTNLWPKTYTFKLQATNTRVWPEEELSIKVSIKAAWWQTWWFMLFVVLFILAFFRAIFKIRTYQIKRRNVLLEQAVLARTEEVEQQKSELEIQAYDLRQANEQIRLQNSELANRTEETIAQNEEITRQKEIIDKKNEDITKSLIYAQRIQQAAIPSISILEKTFPDSFVFLVPREIVSGDFYWMGKMKDKIIVAAADCTGHGVPGAFMSMLGISFLNDIVLGKDILKSEHILERLRTLVKRSLKQESDAHRAKDGMDIALCVIDEGLKKLEFSGANNPMFLIRDGELFHYKGNKNPIGIFVREKPFDSLSINLQKGDIIYLFTDGYIDQFGSNNGEKFMVKRFKKLLLDIHHLPMSEQLSKLEENLIKWQGNSFAQVDDILVLGFKV